MTLFQLTKNRSTKRYGTFITDYIIQTLIKRNVNLLFVTIQDQIKTLNEEDREFLEDDFTLAELEIILKEMKDGKSPGIDGLTSEFYKYILGINKGSVV